MDVDWSAGIGLLLSSKAVVLGLPTAFSLLKVTGGTWSVLHLQHCEFVLSSTGCEGSGDRATASFLTSFCQERFMPIHFCAKACRSVRADTKRCVGCNAVAVKVVFMTFLHVGSIKAMRWVELDEKKDLGLFPQTE